MNIILNNNQESFEGDRLTVNEILKAKKFSFKMLVIRINGKLVKKDEYDTAIVNDGDKLDVIHLVSGG
ncbi:MAG: sulfur carrier protein ThiS [Bacteroidota bacterium]|nr:sulfur carrier protein ThiS [Bacteroidota bacterium]